MSDIWYVIVYSSVGGILSLIGGYLLVFDKRKAKVLSHYATPFAAGALLAAAFTDLLPEAAIDGNVERALYWAMIGILAFFILERFLKWFHHHHEHEPKKASSDPNISLIVIGDTIHNFIDGIAIGAAFLVDVQTGIAASIAVSAHEIPQEIGDFGLLLKKGMSRANVVKVNTISALATVVAAVSFFQLGRDSFASIDLILGLVAGFFIYIAVSDIIPSIHKSEDKVIAGPQTLMLILGVIVVSVVSSALDSAL